MTDYGASPATPPRTRPVAGLPVADLAAAGLGLVAFVLAFLPWLGLKCPNTPGSTACDRINSSGWQLPAGTAAVVLLVLAGLLLLARQLDAAAPAPVLPMVLAVLGAVLVVIQLGVGYGSTADVAEIGTSRKVSLYLVLVVALAEAAVLVLSWLQGTGRLARRPATAVPAGPGQPWQQPAPGPGVSQGWGQPSPGPPAPPGPPPPPGPPARYGPPRDYPPPGVAQPPPGPPPGPGQGPAYGPPHVGPARPPGPAGRGSPREP
jgi:hypothetical protein